MTVSFNYLGQFGRIGNQMFQYAFLLGLHAKYGYDISIPPSEFKNAWVHHQLFEAFKLKSLKKENLFYNDHIDIHSNFCTKEKQFNFDEDLFNNAKDNINYHGYFQSEKYFEHCKDLVRENFEFLDHIKNKCSKFMKQFENKTVLSIHIRRGDYIGRPHEFPIPNEKYFKKCFDLVGHYDYAIVFSDDYEWCNEQKIFSPENIIFSKTFDPVNYNKDLSLTSNNSNLYDLCLMSMCDKHIIANSSFSWWGAWLANSSTVCYPDPWFGESYMNNIHHDFSVLIDLKDLCPSHWTKVTYNRDEVEYKYINDKNILITQRTINDNSYTWKLDNEYKIADKEVIEKFVSYIKDDFTILDIGAQSGCFTLSSKFYPNTKWYAFEPDTWNRNLLLDNLKLNSIQNVSVSEEALCEKIGETVLNICHSHRGLNTLGKNPKRFYKQDSFEYQVKTNTIDNLFFNTQIDLMKIDTEGSEYDIIVGGIQTIKKYKPKILLEYNDLNLQQCGYSIEDLNNLIEEIGYKISWSMTDNVFIEYKI